MGTLRKTCKCIAAKVILQLHEIEERNSLTAGVKMDIGWGGVPRMSPSDTALRYLNDSVKVRAECGLPAGGHLRSRRIMEEELRGYKQGKADLVEQYDAYYLQMKRLNMDDDYLRRLRKMGKGAVGTDCKVPMGSVYNNWTRIGKPGAGLGWTEPRMESVVGLVDRRLHLRGYVRGVRKRDSKFT